MTTRERDAWTLAYRLYDEYAPKIRQAATQDDETAGQLFLAIMERVKPHYTDDGGGNNWILTGVCDILDYVFQAARTGAEQAQKRRTEAI